MTTEKPTMYHGIKEAASKTGLPIELFRRANLHPDCPHSTKGGFAKSGRVYMSKDFEQWLADHKKELLTVKAGSREYWQILRIKYQTLALEAELAKRQSTVINKQDAIATFDRIAIAFKALVNGRFRTQIIDGLQLTPDKVADLDAALGDICGVMDKGFDSFK